MVAVWEVELGWSVTTSHTRFEALYSERLYVHRRYECGYECEAKGGGVQTCIELVLVLGVRMRMSPEEIEKTTCNRTGDEWIVEQNC